MNKIYAIATGLLIMLSSCAKKQETLKVASPGNALEIGFYLTADGEPGYTASYKSKAVVDSSAMGFVLSGEKSLDMGFKVVKSSTSSFDETWEQPWGEERLIRNQYNELKVELANTEGLKMNIVFRAFDYGLAFRYEFPEQEGLKEFEILDELTEFKMAGDHQAWWTPALASNRYEYIYEKDPLSKLKLVHSPLTMETADGLYLSLHEAALKDFPSYYVKGQGNTTLKLYLVPF